MKIAFLAIGIVATPVLAIAASGRLAPAVPVAQETAFLEGESYPVIAAGVMGSLTRGDDGCGPDRRSVAAGPERKDDGTGTAIARTVLLTDAGFAVSSLGGGATAERGTRAGC